MGLFDKLFGGKEKESSTAMIERPPCPHGVLVPRWDGIEDIGREDKASYYICESCEEKFTPDVAKTMRENAAARLVGGSN